MRDDATFDACVEVHGWTEREVAVRDPRTDRQAVLSLASVDVEPRADGYAHVTMPMRLAAQVGLA